MPNTTKPILTAEDVKRYRNEINSIDKDFIADMTVKLTGKTTADTIKEAKDVIIAAKLYPEGVTTNSEDGIRSIRDLFPVLKAMQDYDRVLCIHGEMPGVFTLDREAAYFETVTEISDNFPRLRIVLEHITTAAAVGFVASMPSNVAATITVHHLFLTLDDVIGGSLRPHLFCKPVAKRAEDRAALVRAALNGNPKFFLGTDSAPHLVGKKECSSGCAGVFTAPVAMSCLAELFFTNGRLTYLEDFTSTFGARFYGLSRPGNRIEIVREFWRVPDQYDGVVPFRAGEPLEWTVKVN
jgi:dihydroorotase